MPNKLQVFLHYYLSKLKNCRPQIQSSSPKNWILSGCKKPKTPSFAIARRNDDAATLSDIDRFLFENFKSLFNNDDSNSTTRVPDQENHEAPKLGSITLDSTRFIDPELLDNPDGCESIAVLTRSARPFEEFRRSMREMVEARMRSYERVDWGFMEELLFCYLNVNEKKSYRFILIAFVDLVNVLRRRSSERAPATAKPRSVRTVRIGREIRRMKNTDGVKLEFEEKKDAGTGRDQNAEL